MDFARGIKAPSFSLRSTDDTRLNLSDLAGKYGTVVVFICNHCPYVISALDDMKYEAQALQNKGIEVIAICSNHPIKYPDDSFDKMQKFAVQNAFNFPYVHDEDQSVARAYNAQCIQNQSNQSRSSANDRFSRAVERLQGPKTTHTDCDTFGSSIRCRSSTY